MEPPLTLRETFIDGIKLLIEIRKIEMQLIDLKKSNNMFSTKVSSPTSPGRKHSKFLKKQNNTSPSDTLSKINTSCF